VPSSPRKRESILILLLFPKAKVDSRLRGNDVKSKERDFRFHGNRYPILFFVND
jgi:hypothetical protein